MLVGVHAGPALVGVVRSSENVRGVPGEVAVGANELVLTRRAERLRRRRDVAGSEPRSTGEVLFDRKAPSEG